MNTAHNASLDLNLIAVFDALLREQNVSKAADQLGMSQSAMSHALRRLREFFNDPLFVKTGRGMKPTPRAEDLAATVLGVMGSIRNDLLVATRFDAKKAKRAFSLCMTDLGELIFLPPLIERLREAAPNCTIQSIRIRPKEIFNALESGEIDLALGSLHSIPKGLFQQQLYMRSFTTIVSCKNKKIGDEISVDQYFEMEHITVALADRTEGYYDSVVDDYGRERKIYFTTPHFLTIPLIIERNPDLIATVPRELGTVFSKFNTVRMVPPPIPLPQFTLRQHWHPRYHHDEANTWLRRLVKETFDSLSE
ncbi:LysR family transcriptional regulator [Noviherbaspirillum sedimenti]|uniref:LysR family transcriptional regulator n=2 Tax=Noviherbaspirillum sedimenti TaxID=2320865 RepID=A0A3A3GTW2_9BURK|nr:LysR family transcriptional regulator [Noviherbaspirillum sedimenti]